MAMLFLSLLVLTSAVQVPRLTLTASDVDEDSAFYAAGIFCFDFDKDRNPVGDFSFTIDWDEDYNAENLRLNYYSDQSDRWPLIFNSNTGHYRDMSCEEKVSISSHSLEVVNGEQVSGHIVQGIRPRFWYFTVSNCGSSLTGVSVQGEMLNNRLSKPINWEFGVDTQGLQFVYLIFFLFYTIYLPFNGYVVYKLYTSHGGAVHQFVQIFCFTLLLQYVSVIMYFTHFWSFIYNGIGAVGVYYAAQAIGLVARVIFMALLMFLAEGWTISQVSLEAKSKIAILASLGFTTIVFLALLLWEYTSRTPEMITPVITQQVFYFMLVAFWIFFAVWFMITCRKSYMGMNNSTEANSAKKNLFLALAVLYGPWILSLPLFAYIALLLSPWVYQYTTQVSNIIITTAGFVFFTAIIWPSHSTKFFQPPQRGVTIEDDEYRRL